MGATRYRAPPEAGLLIAGLDDLVAIFDRASGITHLVAPAVPELLQGIAGEWKTLAAIAAEFELVDGTQDDLAAMIDDLVDAGLIERA